MDNKYENFLCNAGVINIKNQEEFNDFVSLMEKLGLKQIKFMDRICKKYGFEKGFCYNAGIKYCNPKDVCFEYQLGKGFTSSSIQEYKQYDESIEIYTLDEIKEATGYAIQLDKNTLYKSDSFFHNTIIHNIIKVDEIDTIQDRTKDIKTYTPIDGFYDLRKFDIPEEKFRELWQMQLYFKICQTNQAVIKEQPDMWNYLKELSGKYQSELFNYPQKSVDFIDYEIEK